MPTIRSIEELKNLREEAQKVKEMRNQSGKIQVIVGMGTIGIASGARETLKAILNFIEEKQLADIILRQTGDLGFTGQDPVVKVIFPDEHEVVYGKVNADQARKIMQEHVIDGDVVQELLIRE